MRFAWYKRRTIRGRKTTVSHQLPKATLAENNLNKSFKSFFLSYMFNPSLKQIINKMASASNFKKDTFSQLVYQVPTEKGTIDSGSHFVQEFD